MKTSLPVFLLLLCTVLLAGTFYLLLRDRFETGDVYPPGSTLRSDPLGTMIFYESLQALPGIQVTRDHSAIQRLPEGRNTTYLQLGAKSGDWALLTPETFRLLDQFLLQGGRFVLILSPEYLSYGERRRRLAEPVSEEKADENENTSEKKTESAEKDPEETQEADARLALHKKWGLRFAREPSSATGHAEFLVTNDSVPTLPASLKWHGELVLQDLSPDWTVLYQSEAGPVLAEKKRGPGSVVVATDSYFVSNEALVRDRHPALLSWLVGSGTGVVFDETHLGIMESPGLAALARKYQLTGGVAALLVLAGLFLWKNSSSLVPRHAGSEGPDEVIPGRNTTAGFIGLLRRNIPKDQIFALCLQEWQKSFGHSAKFTPRQKAAVADIAKEEAARPARERNPVAACEKICSILNRTIPTR